MSKTAPCSVTCPSANSKRAGSEVRKLFDDLHRCVRRAPSRPDRTYRGRLYTPSRAAAAARRRSEHAYACRILRLSDRRQDPPSAIFSEVASAWISSTAESIPSLVACKHAVDTDERILERIEIDNAEHVYDKYAIPLSLDYHRAAARRGPADNLPDG